MTALRQMQLVGISAGGVVAAMALFGAYVAFTLVRIRREAPTLDVESLQMELQLALARLLIALLAVVGLTALVAVHVGDIASAPLRAISHRLRAIGRGNFAERVPETGVMEAREIAAAANLMAADLAERERSALHGERLSSLGMLVAGVAHEINNPLTYMRGNAELFILDAEERLARPDLDFEEREFLDLAVAGARANLRGFDHLGALAASLRAVARARGERKEQDLAQVVSGCLVLVHSRLKPRAKVVSELNAKQTVLCDAGEVSQIVINLLLNAADALPEDGQLTVSVRDEGGCVVVRVHDTGPGVPESIRHRLFQPFVTGKAAGTGLGLSLSRRIAEDHGGTLTFESRPGDTVFELRLPAAPAARAIIAG